MAANNVSDSMDQIPPDEQIILSMQMKLMTPNTADKSFQVDKHMRRFHLKNARPWKDKTLRSLERNELLKTVKHLGRTIWKKWPSYHRHSLVETKIKLLGDKQSARNFNSQVNVIHTRIAVLNKFTELGRPHI